MVRSRDRPCPLEKNTLVATVLLFVVIVTAQAIACVPGENGFQASPSAFKSASGTTLYYDVPELANASAVIEISGPSGAVVRTLGPDSVTPGNHETGWDARDGAGVKVPDGTYTLKLIITNETQTIDRSCDVVVDSLAPGTTISFSKLPQSDGSYEKGVAFSLSGSDTGSGISTYHYNINERGWETYCTPVPLNDAGSYTIRYKAIDCAGNYEIQTITVKVIAPAIVTPAPTPAPTEAPTPAPTPVPTSQPTPAPVDPGNRTFDLTPQSVQVHDDGRISYSTDAVSTRLDDRSIAGMIDVNLTHAPEAASLHVYVRSAPEATEATQFKLAVTGCGGEIKGFAGVMVVDHPALGNGADIASATITMKVTEAWVGEHGGADAIKILRYSEGVAEQLDTVCLGTDGDLLVFQAFSPHGLSNFAVAAVSPAVLAAGTTADEGPASAPGGFWLYSALLAIVAAIVGGLLYVIVLRPKK